MSSNPPYSAGGQSATPRSIMVGTGRGATAGVLIKNAEALEKVDVLVVDKSDAPATCVEKLLHAVTAIREQLPECCRSHPIPEVDAIPPSGA